MAIDRFYRRSDLGEARGKIMKCRVYGAAAEPAGKVTSNIDVPFRETSMLETTCHSKALNKRIT